MSWEQFIDRVRGRLETTGKNALEVSVAMGRDRGYVTELLNRGKRSLRWETMVSLAAELDCDPYWLSDGAGPSPDENGDPAKLRELLATFNRLDTANQEVALKVLGGLEQSQHQQNKKRA